MARILIVENDPQLRALLEQQVRESRWKDEAIEVTDRDHFYEVAYKNPPDFIVAGPIGDADFMIYSLKRDLDAPEWVEKVKILALYHRNGGAPHPNLLQDAGADEIFSVPKLINDFHLIAPNFKKILDEWKAEIAPERQDVEKQLRKHVEAMAKIAADPKYAGTVDAAMAQDIVDGVATALGQQAQGAGEHVARLASGGVKPRGRDK